MPDRHTRNATDLPKELLQLGSLPSHRIRPLLEGRRLPGTGCRLSQEIHPMMVITLEQPSLSSSRSNPRGKSTSLKCDGDACRGAPSSQAINSRLDTDSSRMVAAPVAVIRARGGRADCGPDDGSSSNRSRPVPRPSIDGSVIVDAATAPSCAAISSNVGKPAAIRSTNGEGVDEHCSRSHGTVKTALEQVDVEGQRGPVERRLFERDDRITDVRSVSAERGLPWRSGDRWRNCSCLRPTAG